MNNINCIIIDDNDIDRFYISGLIKKFEGFNVVAEFSGAIDSLNELSNNKIDVIFVDIDMPEMTGIELRRRFLNIPVCILVTCHPEFAIISYELEVLDFLVKPINMERFAFTIKRIIEYLSLKEKAYLYESDLKGEILLKKGQKKIKLLQKDIVYLEAFKDYTKFVTINGIHFVLTSFSEILSNDQFSNIMRVHRSFAVPKSLIRNISKQKIFIDDKVSIPIGRKYKDAVNQLFENQKI